MAISTAAKNKRNSDRYMLIRLTPGRYVNDYLSLVSGVYQGTPGVTLVRLERNGVTLIQDASTPSVNDHWYQDSNGLLQVKLAGAPSSTNVLIAYYCLYLTGMKERDAYHTPTDSLTTMVSWQPRLTEYPDVVESVQNSLSGVFSVSASTIEMINTDDYLQQYLTANDSFNRKAVDIWLCVDGTDNIQKVFSGRSGDVRLRRDAATISILDSFAALQQPCLMGDTANQAYWLRLSNQFLLFGDATRYKLVSEAHGTAIKYVFGANRAVLDPIPVWDTQPVSMKYLVDGERAVNISHGDATFPDRMLGLCRIPGTTLAMTSASAIVRTALSTASLGQWFVFCTTHNYAIGDTFTYTVGGTPYYGTVCGIDSFTYQSGGSDTVSGSTLGTTQTYNLIVQPNSAGAANITTSSVIVSNRKIAVSLIVPGGSAAALRTYSLALDYDYSLHTITRSGSTWIYIALGSTFYNTFYADTAFTLPSQRYPDVSQDVVVYRVTPATSATHGAVLKSLVESAGLTTNAASFTAADAALPVSCAFTVPQYDEEDFDSVRSYCEAICKSTGGYLFVNSAGEVEYKLLATPTSTSASDNNSVLKTSLDVQVAYGDIANEIIAYNPHIASTSDLDAAASSSVTTSSLKSQYLHGAKITTRFRHVLADISTRITTLLAFYSNRRATYTLSTATEHMTSALGDDIQLDVSHVLGGSGSVDLKIVDITRSPDRTEIKAEDLLGV